MHLSFPTLPKEPRKKRLKRQLVKFNVDYLEQQQ